MDLNNRIIKTLNLLIFVLALVNLVLYLLSLPLGVYLFTHIHEAMEYSSKTFTPFIILYMTIFRLPIHFPVSHVFILLIIVYTLLFAIAYMMGGIFHKQAKRISSDHIMLPSNNWLLSMPYISGGLLFAIIILQSFQEAHGVPTGSISFQNPFEALFNLTYSPLIEEIGFRVTPIGTLISLIALRHAEKGYSKRILYTILSFFHPEHVKERLGLRTISKNGLLRGLSIYEWILVIASAIIFGLAHYLFGGGWDIGKISSAAFAGVILSLVFLWKGFPACVLLHWFFNYFGYVYEVAGDYINPLSRVVTLIEASIFLSGIISIMVIGLRASTYVIKVFKR